jgi:hypothetical protein
MLITRAAPIFFKILISFYEYMKIMNLITNFFYCCPDIDIVLSIGNRVMMRPIPATINPAIPKTGIQFGFNCK